MPYINDDMKHGDVRGDVMFQNPSGANFEQSVDELIKYIRTHTSSDRDGMCNYAISRIVAGSLKPSTGWKYKNLNRAYGTFLSAAAEFYARLVRPYEIKCIKKNGDIPEYEPYLENKLYSK